MELPVLIEPIADNGFRAWFSETLGLVAEGPTRAQALAKLKQMLDQRVQSGLEITAIPIANSQVTAPAHGGIWNEHDPDVQEWLRTMEENRRLDDIREGIER